MNTPKFIFPLVSLILAALSVAQAAETLVHYRVNSGDSTTSVPNLGTLGNGLPNGSGVTYSFDTPSVGVPDGGGDNSIICDGAGGVVAPGTQHLLNSAILVNGGFTFETWFKWNGNGDFNAIIDYAGTEKIYRRATTSLRMQTNNAFDSDLGAVPANEWRHVAVVFDNVTAAAGTHVTGNYTFYLNGGLLFTTGPVTINDLGDSLDRSIGVGTHPIGAFTDNFFNGLIYEPKVTLGALSANELFFDATVTTLADEDDGYMGGGDGISLREAIKYSAPGSTITFEEFFAGGTVFLDETLRELVIPHDLEINAAGFERPIGISGQGNVRIFDIEGTQTVTLNGLILVNGDSGAENGGAIYASGTALTLIDCTIRGCEALCGGAITNDSALTLINCTLSDNTAGTGGAICNGGILTMQHCTIAQNVSTGAAGAIANFGSGDLALTHCTISNNSAVSHAGGLGKFGGTLTMGHTILARNFAPIDPDLNGSIDTDNGSNILGGSPILSPLGNYGGPTETMLPLNFSPAVDPAQSSGSTTDQRGFARDGSPDIGAAERPAVVTVTNANDSGPGSLRAAVDAAGPEGAMILISQNLAGQTLTLTSGQMNVSNVEGLIIDGTATAPNATFKISGNNASRVFSIGFGSSAIFRDLQIIDGFSGQGAGVFNGGHLDLIACTIQNNLTLDGKFFQGGSGGGLFNDVGQFLRLSGCTVNGNATGAGIPGEGSDNGGLGAGIFNLGTLLLDRTTVTGNHCASGGDGGGIFSLDGFVGVKSSTITGNSASAGGAIFGSSSIVRVEHSIVSFNSAASFPNIAGGFSENGTNNITDDDPVLATLGDYGGRTFTMPPVVGSPAIDQAIGATHTFDQRGVVITGIPDLGATEFQEPATTIITWADPAAITFGTALSGIQLNATANHPGTITYSPVLGTVLVAGVYTLTATFTPDDPNFHTTETANATLVVSKATPLLTWTAPSPIRYGTALSGAQLNATASNGATVTYTPAAGQVLSAGTTQLTASLAATDNFAAVSKSVNLTVNKAPLIVTADDKQREAGEANPPLTLSYNGFVNGDTAIAVTPSLATAATVASAPGTYPITLSGGSGVNYTLSFVPGRLIISGLPVSVSGSIWQDLDEDGIRSASDPGIAGAQVLIFDASGQQLIALTTTSLSGSYRLGESDGLTPGPHTLALVLSAEDISSDTLWVSTLRDQGGDEATDSDLAPCDLVAGICLTQAIVIPDGLLQWDGGLMEQGFNRGTVQGLLWNDTNQDSSLVGEAGFGNATVHLLSAGGDRLRTAKTDLNGVYQFLNVLPGEYRVRFEKPAGIDHFSAQTGESEVSADGMSEVVILELGDDVSVSAGISAEPAAQGLALGAGSLRSPAETAQGIRLHQDVATGEMSLRFTVLPLLRTAEGTEYFPAQRIEVSTDFHNWQETGMIIPASSTAASREERIALPLSHEATFFRVRVEPSNQ